MVNKYFNGEVGQTAHNHEYRKFETELEDLSAEVVKNYNQAMDEFKISNALQEVSRLVARTNKLIDDTSPWNLAKDESLKAVLASTMYHLLESIRLITILYRPVLLESCGKIFDALNVEPELREMDKASFGEKGQYHVEKTIAHLFPRLDSEKEVEYIKQGMNTTKPKTVEIIQKPEISIEQFEPMDIKVGLVLEATKHPNAAKLLILKVNTDRKSVV